MFINAELALLDSNGPDMQLYRGGEQEVLARQPARHRSARWASSRRRCSPTRCSSCPEDQLDKEGINEAILNIKNYKTDILCKPWYFQKMKLHMPNNTDRTVTPKGGKMTEARAAPTSLTRSRT